MMSFPLKRLDPVPPITTILPSRCNVAPYGCASPSVKPIVVVPPPVSVASNSVPLVTVSCNVYLRHESLLVSCCSAAGRLIALGRRGPGKPAICGHGEGCFIHTAKACILPDGIKIPVVRIYRNVWNAALGPDRPARIRVERADFQALADDDRLA